jgi:hypothetical protein
MSVHYLKLLQHQQLASIIMNNKKR